jgi:hypothetical protein
MAKQPLPEIPRDIREKVTHFRERLRDCSDYPTLDELESAWQLLNARYGNFIDRDKRASRDPLAEFAYFVEMGFYPPPELMLAISDAFQDYRDAEGKLTLEEVYFGKPKRKGGTYARRKHAFMRRMHLSMELDKLVRGGKTKLQAAELLAEKYWGENLEPESIVRLAGSFPNKSRKNKRLNNPRKG